MNRRSAALWSTASFGFQRAVKLPPRGESAVRAAAVEQETFLHLCERIRVRAWAARISGYDGRVYESETVRNVRRFRISIDRGCVRAWAKGSDGPDGPMTFTSIIGS